jgi:hypothetical protein
LARRNAWSDELEPLGQLGVAALEQRVDARTEGVERLVVKLRPAAREEMVVEHVNHDSGVAPARRAHARS